MNINTLMRRVEVADSGCWLWLGAVTSDGYPRVWHNGKPRRAHRVVFESVVGDIPDGLELDHLSGVRRCVNPSHLEAVTRRENQYRGFSITGRNARKTHCDHGHEFNEANTYLDRRGKRQCRPCRRISQRRAA